MTINNLNNLRKNPLEQVSRLKKNELCVWYDGDSDKIVDFYLTRLQGLTSVKYFLNSKEYFWVQSSSEDDFKKTHSGMPRQIIKTLGKVTGVPNFNVCEKDENNELKENISLTDRLYRILQKNKFNSFFKDQIIAYNLLLGNGVVLINTAKGINHPIYEFYDARNFKVEMVGNVDKKVICKKFYSVTNDNGDVKNYCLHDEREANKIKLTLYLIDVINQDNYTYKEEVPLSTIEELKGAEKETILPEGLKSYEYFQFDYDFENHEGVSIYAGKIDQFDDLDQSLSQRSNCVRTSSPVDYVSDNVLDYDSEGRPIKPKKFNRQFLIYKHDKNATGEILPPVQTTQPTINFDQYSSEALETLMMIMNGIISPSTMGIELSRKDNALAMREKEKVTLFSRQEIIDAFSDSLEELMKNTLNMADFMSNQDNFTYTDYDISVEFDDYSSPTYDAKLEYIGQAVNNRIMSTEQAMEELHPEWQDDKKEQEATRIKESNDLSIQSSEDDMMRY